MRDMHLRILLPAVAIAASAKTTYALPETNDGTDSLPTEERRTLVDNAGDDVEFSETKPLNVDDSDAAELENKLMKKQERREKLRARMASHKPNVSELHRLTKEEIDEAIRKAKASEGDAASSKNHEWLRRVGSDPYSLSTVAAPGAYYDMWQQAYRMLGGYIDCDHQKDQGGSGSGDNNRAVSNACSRWMMWAAYVDPDYQGNGYDEYYGDGATGVLDCHDPNTNWVLLGVYRQEFYQYIEQISKHLWAIDDYNYIVARAGLLYMTDDDCFQVGNDSNGNALYGGVQPMEGGTFQMKVYTDEQCLTVTDDHDFDDFGLTSDVDLGSKDEEDDDGYYAQEIWKESQEATLTNLNDVYDTYRYCTSCVDYPTYQDGYFIGDYGTDEDDLINQCWKFHSHDSFTCEADCISLGQSQGTINYIKYGDMAYGQMLDTRSYGSSQGSNQRAASTTRNTKMEKLKANIFVTFSGIMFIATFLAFAVARGSRKSDSSGKSRRLLGGEGRSRRSKSRSRKESKEKSKSRKSRSRILSLKSSSRDTGDKYEPPNLSSKKKKSRSKGRSGNRRFLDDF